MFVLLLFLLLLLCLKLCMYVYGALGARMRGAVVTPNSSTEYLLFLMWQTNRINNKATPDLKKNTFFKFHLIFF